MPPTLVAPRHPVIYTPLSVVDEHIGRRLMVKACTAGQMRKMESRESVFRRAEVITEELVKHGHRDEAERRIGRLQEIVTLGPQPFLCTALLISESDADADLAKVRSRYQLDASHDNAIALGRALEKHESIERAVTLALRELGSD